MSDRIKLFDHPKLGVKSIELRKDDLNYYFLLLRDFFEYFLDKDLTQEQVSIGAAVIKEFMIKNDLIKDDEESSRILRLATYISSFSVIKSEDRLEGMIERVRKYIYE